MISILFLGVMRALTGAEPPSCRQCVLMPWLVLLAAYLSCATLRRVELTCLGALRIGVHAAAAAALYAQAPAVAFACSSHSLLHVLPPLASDEVTACVLSGYCIALLGAIVRLCSHTVSSDILLMALVWPRVVDIGYTVLQRLLWGE